MDIRIIDDLCIIDEYPMTIERINGYISDLGVNEYSISRYRSLKRVPEKTAKKRTRKIFERWIDLITANKAIGWNQRRNWEALRMYYGVGARKTAAKTIVEMKHFRNEDDLLLRIRGRLKYLRRDKFEKWHKLILISLYLPDPQYEGFIDALLESIDEVEATMRRMEQIRQIHNFYNDIFAVVK